MKRGRIKSVKTGKSIMFILFLSFTILSLQVEEPSASASASVGGIIEGVVMDSFPGLPIERANVVLKKGSSTIAKTKSLSDGRYGFYELEKGKYTIIVKKSGYKTTKVKGLKVKPGETITKDIFMKPILSPEDIKDEVTISTNHHRWPEDTTSVVESYGIPIDWATAFVWPYAAGDPDSLREIIVSMHERGKLLVYYVSSGIVWGGRRQPW